MTQDRNPANIEISQQVLSVSGTLNPTTHRHLHWVSMAKVVSDVFCKRSDIKSHFLMSLVEAIMSDRTSSLSHVNIMSHGYVMQLLIPTQGGQIHFCLPKLVRKIKCPYSPLLRGTFASALSIVSLSRFPVYYCLRVGDRHHS
jgi:hypothetical protein